MDNRMILETQATLLPPAEENRGDLQTSINSKQLPQNPFNAEIPCAPWAVWTRDQGSINAHSGIILTLRRMPSLFLGRGNFSGFDECFKHLFDAPKTRQLSPGSILFFPPTAQIPLLSETFSTKPRKGKETSRNTSEPKEFCARHVDSKTQGFWMCRERVEQIEKSFNHWVGASQNPNWFTKTVWRLFGRLPILWNPNTSGSPLTHCTRTNAACINNWSLFSLKIRTINFISFHHIFYSSVILRKSTESLFEQLRSVFSWIIGGDIWSRHYVHKPVESNMDSRLHGHNPVQVLV